MADGDDHRLMEPSRADLYWHDFQQRLPEFELTVCTRAAGAILTASSILLAAYSAIAPRRSPVVIVLGLVAVAMALSVLMPTRWRMWQNRPAIIREHFTTMVRKKVVRLWIAFGFLTAAVLAWVALTFV